jgi:hypothetical protein
MDIETEGPAILSPVFYVAMVSIFSLLIICIGLGLEYIFRHRYVVNSVVDPRKISE